MARTRESETVRREQIADATHRVAVRDGLEGVTVRAVAAEAGLSHGLVGFYYPKKIDLLHVLFDRLLRWLDGDGRTEGGLPNIRGQSVYRAALAQELDISGSDRPNIRLILEFWILGFRDETFRNRISDAVAASSRYFSDAFDIDKKRKPKFVYGVDTEALNEFSICLILGNALLSLINAGGSHGGGFDKILDRLFPE